jgi:hypothetical protein
METSVPTETTETSIVPQEHPIWGTGYPSPGWDALPGRQVILLRPTSLCPYGHDDLLPQNLPLRALAVALEKDL